MKEPEELRGRFLREPVPRRLGNLASTLLRLADFIEIRRPRESVLTLIDEAEHFITWTQPDLDPARAGLLAQLLADLKRWRISVSSTDADADLASVEGQARDWTDRIIEISGLITERP